MKIEKKLIALSILALIIGMATILPLVYLTPRTTTVQTPFFNPTIRRISVSVGPFSQSFDSAALNVHMDYVMTSDTTNFKEVDAKIEVYNFHFYTDHDSVANITHSVAITGNVSDSNSPSGVINAIVDCAKDRDTYTFADGTVYDLTKTLGTVEGSIVTCFDSEDLKFSYRPDGHLILGGGASIFDFDGEKSVQKLAILKSTQTLYVDVTRVMSVTYKHSSNILSQSTITALMSSEILYHIELPKVDGGFRYTSADLYGGGDGGGDFATIPISPTSHSGFNVWMVPVESIMPNLSINLFIQKIAT